MNNEHLIGTLGGGFGVSLKLQGCVYDIRTHGETYGRTDTPSFRDARTHLKQNNNVAYGLFVVVVIFDWHFFRLNLGSRRKIQLLRTR